MDAGIQSLMGGGVARRAFAGLAVLALAVVTAGCGANLSFGDWTAPALPASPQAHLGGAEIVDYDGEVLTVRADLVNDEASDNVSVPVWFACVEVEGRERPCFYEIRPNRPFVGPSYFALRRANGRHEAEGGRIMSGGYRFGYWQSDEWSGGPGNIYWNCRVSGAVPEGCTGIYGDGEGDQAGLPRLPEPLERRDVDAGIEFAELNNAGGGVSLEPGDEVQVLFRFRVPDLMPDEGIRFYWRDSQATLRAGDGEEIPQPEGPYWRYLHGDIRTLIMTSVPELASAEIVEYDGEFLAVLADVSNENSELPAPLSLESSWVQRTDRDERHGLDSARIMSGSYVFGTSDGLGSARLQVHHRSDRWFCAVENTVLQQCRALHDILIIQVTQVDFDFGDVNNFFSRWLYLEPGDSVQVLYRFRIPDLTPGDTVKFYGVTDEHFPQSNRPPVELVVE